MFDVKEVGGRTPTLPLLNTGVVRVTLWDVKSVEKNLPPKNEFKISFSPKGKFTTFFFGSAQSGRLEGRVWNYHAFRSDEPFVINTNTPGPAQPAAHPGQA